MEKFKVIVLTLLGIVLVSCNQNQGDVLEKIASDVNFKVNYYVDDCVGVAPQQCMLVQEGDMLGTDKWNFFYDTIEGFTYEPGYVYGLVVAKTTIKNPPADASSIKYTLMKLVTKTRH